MIHEKYYELLEKQEKGEVRLVTLEEMYSVNLIPLLH